MLNLPITISKKLGSVAGPVIQANGRLTFEDDLRSVGLLKDKLQELILGLLHFTTQ